MAVDGWLRGQLLPSESSPLLPYFLTGVTFLDHLVLEEFTWQTFSRIIQNGETRPQKMVVALDWLVDLFDRKGSYSTFPRIFSQFLMDQARAGPLWVNSRRYVNLAKKIVKILRDK